MARYWAGEGSRQETQDGNRIAAERLTLWASVGLSGLLFFILFLSSYGGRQAQWRRAVATTELLRALEVHQSLAAELRDSIEHESVLTSGLFELQLARLESNESKLIEELERAVESDWVGSGTRTAWLASAKQYRAYARSALTQMSLQESSPLRTLELADWGDELNEAATHLQLELLDRQKNHDQSFYRSQIVSELGVVLAVLGLFVGFVIPSIVRRQKQQDAFAVQADELERLALVARSTTNAVMLTDAKRRIVWVNEAFVRLTGFSMSEAIGMNPRDLVQYEGTDPNTVEQIRVALNKGQGIQTQIRNRSKSGREYWAALEIQPLFDKPGVLSGYLSVSSDITSEVELRERLHESDDRLTTATTSAVVGLWDWYPVTDQAWFSDPWWTMLGYEPGCLPMTGKTFFSLIHPDDQAMVQASVDAHARGEEPDYRVEFRMRTQQGAWRWIKAIGKITQRNAVGEPLRFSGVHLDVHLQRLALEAAASSELRLQTIAANVPGMIYQLRVYPDGRIALPYVSPSCAKLFNATANELLFDADRLLGQFQQADQERFLKVVKESAQSLREFRSEVTVGDDEQSLRHYELQGKPEREWDGSVLIHGYMHDISDRKVTDEALRESERRFRDLADSVPVLVWLTGIDGQATDFNQEWLTFTGRTLEQELETGRAESVHPDDLDRFLRTFSQASEKMQPFEMEYRIRRHDGVYRWILDRGHPRHDAQGTFIGYIGGCLDVTDRRIAEVELARRESELRTVLANSPGIAYRRLDDPSQRVVFVSERIQELTGISADQFLSGELSLFDLVVPDDVERVQSQIRDAVSHRQRWSVEYGMRDANGQTRWILEQGSASFNVFGDEAIVDGYLVDVTELKSATSEATRWRELATAIIESALDAVISLDDQGNIVVWNYRASQLFGLDEATARATRLEGLIDVELLGPNGLRRSERSLGMRFETTALHSTGRRFPVEVALCNTKIQGQAHSSVFVRDISASQQARLDLEKARKEAEAANLAKSEFLANMSHEIRTPMTAILGYADLLSDEDSFEGEVERRTAAVDSIQRNGKHLLAVINDILDLSKIEAGKMQVNVEPVEPLKLVREVVDLLRVRAEASGLALSLELPPALPETIQTDAMRIRQILVNLLGNAIKFTELGSVKLRLEWLDARSKEIDWIEPVHRELSQMRFSVIDTGAGMTAEQTEKLFQPFSQVDSSMSRRHGGSGLGLTISKRLAENLGGTLMVTSQVRKGSCFTLVLPIETGSVHRAIDCSKDLDVPLSKPSEPGDRSADSAGNPIRPLDGIRLLLAEDGPDNQRLISFLLKKAGASIEVVENGRLACERLLGTADQASPTPEMNDPSLPSWADFDLVLMDMQMPELDGYQATAMLRQAGCDLPIVALTAHAMNGDREKCLEAGCNDYATKPIDRNALISLVSRWVPKASASAGRSHTLK